MVARLKAESGESGERMTGRWKFELPFGNPA